ncbi:protein translocase subunit SecF [Nocardioides sp. TRM66260-LWL]|uniref:protein translocase subunit SecF n=1 Tax=Nocardioides sp. TRM66260-LWL TaxID=2874478 RepID=UPI001CC6A211|nr:protein translocase subunit SecF [Nocardioides sp. TRM66260-LWL]MBZ5733811.1 protein translocase subunit SecF [Nocardioides sp. TRM66260-LWL]
MGKFSRLGNELYNGRRSIDFVGRRRTFYAISLVLVAGAIAIILLKGMNFGVEFTGGVQYQATVQPGAATQGAADDLRQKIADSGVEGAGNPSVTTAGDAGLIVQVEDLSTEANDQLAGIITQQLGIPASSLSQDEIGASWGKEVGQRAAIGVLVFLVLTVLFIWGYFREWKMSVAALVALFHDIALTVGVYAISGFTVTPSAVTGLLAILGFSLYDTVVVFDKIRENTKDLRTSRTTYAAAANLAVNQTLVRSINTSIVALIPIGAILYVATVQLGASSLQDLALAQFVGMAVGVYSSVFLAPRVLVHLKSTEDDVKAAEKRAKARAKAQADKYAAVPAFSEDLAVADEPDELREDDDRSVAAAPRSAPPRQQEALGRGRTAPASRGPVAPTNAAGRAQPSRQPKSKRGKR